MNALEAIATCLRLGQCSIHCVNESVHSRTRLGERLFISLNKTQIAQRSSHDVQRNEVASIVSRVLTCYEGILFLTTNGAGDIDAVFQSRIHVTLRYEELGREARKGIWKAFLTAITATPKHHVAPFGFRDCIVEEPEKALTLRSIIRSWQHARLRTLVRYPREHPRQHVATKPEFERL